MKKIKELVMVLLPFALLMLAQPVDADTTKTAKTTNSKTVSKSTKTKSKKDSVKIITTDQKNSYVILNKNTYFVDSNNKKTKSLAKKESGYRIYYARYSGSIIYYGTKSKKWLPSSSVRGTVWYREDNNNMMILSTDSKGVLSYQLYNPVNAVQLRVKRNSYVYNDQGLLNKGTVITLNKGQKVTGYALKTVNGTQFYITDQGWVKAKNLEKIPVSNKTVKKTKKK